MCVCSYLKSCWIKSLLISRNSHATLQFYYRKEALPREIYRDCMCLSSVPHTMAFVNTINNRYGTSCVWTFYSLTDFYSYRFLISIYWSPYNDTLVWIGRLFSKALTHVVWIDTVHLIIYVSLNLPEVSCGIINFCSIFLFTLAYDTSSFITFLPCTRTVSQNILLCSLSGFSRSDILSIFSQILKYRCASKMIVHIKFELLFTNSNFTLL